jgi:TonB family protein
MNEAPADSALAGPPPDESWPRARWLKFIVVIFTAQVALLFILGENKPVVPRVVTSAPTVRFADGTGELLALNDPTLFVLPQQRDFAAAGCLKTPDIKPPPLRWTEPPRWLPLSADSLGAAFGEFMQNQFFPAQPLNFKPEPELTAPMVAGPALAQNSTLRVAGELAQRQLPAPVNLPSWPHADVLAPCVVQALVDAAGNVVSTVILSPSGDDTADQRALDLARALRFAPAPRPTVGNIIFNWHTVPPANE